MRRWGGVSQVATNVHEASQGNDLITANISHASVQSGNVAEAMGVVKVGSEETREMSLQVRQAVQEMNAVSERLGEAIARFRV